MRCSGLTLLDLLAATTGAALFSPLLVVAAGLIRLEDGGPVFFVQERVGKHRRSFRILKLRTMREGRPTHVGRWLRATGIDEVPQFVHVLCGEMRMVGPRPLRLEDIRRLGWDGPEHDARFSVPPGITGLAQLFGTSAAESSELDRWYLRHRSVPLDLGILTLSFAVNVVGKRTVRRAMKAISWDGRAKTGA
ncbi:MAG: sugar transferase [Myxococcota bacterium]